MSTISGHVTLASDLGEGRHISKSGNVGSVGLFISSNRFSLFKYKSGFINRVLYANHTFEMSDGVDGRRRSIPGDYMEPAEEWEREGLLDPAWERQQKKVN